MPVAVWWTATAELLRGAALRPVERDRRDLFSSRVALVLDRGSRVAPRHPSIAALLWTRAEQLESLVGEALQPPEPGPPTAEGWSAVDGFVGDANDWLGPKWWFALTSTGQWRCERHSSELPNDIRRQVAAGSISADEAASWLAEILVAFQDADAPGWPLLHAGQPADVLYNDDWYPATVLSEPGAGLWQVSYDGYGPEWNEVVGPDRIRPQAAPGEPRVVTVRVERRDAPTSARASAAATPSVIAAWRRVARRLPPACR